MAASLAAWLVASAAGSAAAKGLFELGTAPYWGMLLAATQGLVLRRRGVPYTRWVIWSAGGWAVGALIGARLISAAVRWVVPLASGHLGTSPADLLQKVAVFSVFGAAQLGAVGSHMPARLMWVALNALSGAVISYGESPLRIFLFGPVEAAAGVAAAEAAVGAALGAIYGAITAPQMVRIRATTKRLVRIGERNFRQFSKPLSGFRDSRAPRAAAAPRRSW